MKYSKYDEYKDSGTKWFEEIPSNWDVRPIKHLANTIPGGTPSTSNLEYWENGNIPWLPSGMVQNCQIYNKDAYKFITEKGLLNSATKYIGPDSVLVALTGATCANIGFLTFKATANQSVISVEPYSSIPKYIYYALLSQREQILDKKTGGAQSGINEDDVKNILIPVMSIQEQQQIANYLDKQTTRIDATIAKNEELIQLLEEKRVALINQVVTKGLNPDVPMKDTGIEWIGEIPEHWDCRKINTLSSVSRGASPRPIDDPIYFDENGEYSWVRISDVTSSNKYLEQTTEKLSTLGKSLSVPIEPGNIFVSIAATVGKPIIANIKCCIHDGFVYFKNLDMNNEYLFYIFAGGEAYKGLGKLGTQLNLNTETIGKIYIPVPPEDEQAKIIKFLDEEIDKVDKTINKVQENIDLLDEYKTSLIHHVVTGKIDVRGENI